MKVRALLLYKKGDMCPIFYRGTLEEKFDELMDTQTKIKRIYANERTKPSEKLLDQRGELEIEISRHLINGEKLEDEFMDYCLKNFAGGNTLEINMRSIRNPSVFDRTPKVKKFSDYIKKNVDKKILSTYGKNSKEFGIISGPVEFSIEDNFRYLNVPVKQLFEFEDNEWGSNSCNKLYVNPDIFAYPAFNLFNRAWKTNHSKELCVGGPGPEETGIYIGNGVVEKKLRKSKTIPAF